MQREVQNSVKLIQGETTSSRLARSEASVETDSTDAAEIKGT